MTAASLATPVGSQWEGGDPAASGPVVSLAKAEGAFLAFAAGDALGWPQEIERNLRGGADVARPRIEFRSWTRQSGRHRPYEETIGAGEYSDDTQLMLAVARSRTNHGGDWWKAFMRVELPRWTMYERGGGSATKRAARAWLAGRPPWQSGETGAVRRYFHAGGNGAAMRVLPHALFLAGQEDPAGLARDVVRDGAVTHGHPRALVGATVSAYAAWSLVRRNRTLRFGELLDLLIDEHDAWAAFPEVGRGGEAWFAAATRVLDEPYGRLWARTVDEMRRLLEQARRGIRAGGLADDRAVLADLGCFGHLKGAGTVTAAAAAYLASRHAAQPAQGVLWAASEQGADTDTLAAVTGGLLECLAGDEWLPAPWRKVQDAGYLGYIAGRVAQGPEGADQRPIESATPPHTILTDLARNEDQEIAIGEYTRGRPTPLPDRETGSKSSRVRAWCLRTRDGQTMYVTSVEELRTRGPQASTAGSVLDQRTAATAETATDDSREPAAGRRGPESGVVPDCSPCDEFRQRLRTLLKTGPKRSREIEVEVQLVPRQARKWLKRAEQEGEIERAPGHPLKFTLRRRSRT